MQKQLTNQEIFNKAKEYLLGFRGITDEILNKQLAFPGHNRPNNKETLFKRMIDHSKNRQGMPNAIGDTSALSKCLYDFDADKVIENYESWENLFDTIQVKCSPPGRMVKNNPHNYWVIFCKSILSIAKFLSRFKKIGDFDAYVKQFITETPDTRLALPLILKEEIFGYQFALACDFVKENISPLFVKPDVHIKAIFIGIGLSEPDASDFQIFRDVVRFAESIGQVPYAVDKLFWLIGSGNFYESSIRVPTNRNEFIKNIHSYK